MSSPALATELRVATALSQVASAAVRRFFQTVRFLLLIGAIVVAPFNCRSQGRLGFVLGLTLVVYMKRQWLWQPRLRIATLFIAVAGQGCHAATCQHPRMGY
jgi:hypothetical protein